MSTSTRTIEFYVVDRRQLWLDLDYLEWALRFMYMQIVLQRAPGVIVHPCPSPEAESQWPMVMGRRGSTWVMP